MTMRTFGRAAGRHARSLARAAVVGTALAGGVAGAAACGRAREPEASHAPAGSASAAGPGAALADTLTAQITAAYDFTRPGVPARLLALYAPGEAVVSATAGAVTTSRGALRAEVERFWERVGRNMRGARFVVGERHLTPLGPDAAALTLTYTIPHRTPEGREHTLAGAWTAVFRREGGRWVIVQEHLSDAPAGGGATHAPPPAP